MNQELRFRILLQLSINNVRRYPGMDVTLSGPDLHLALSLLHNMAAEKHVRQEENLTIARNTVHHLHRIAGCAGIVALSFDFGSRIDIGYYDRLRMLSLPSPKLVRVDSRCQ